MSLRKVLLRLVSVHADLDVLVEKAPKSRSKADQHTLVILRHQVEMSIQELKDTQTVLRSGEYPPTQRINKALGVATPDPDDEPQGMDDIDTIGRHQL